MEQRISDTNKRCLLVHLVHINKAPLYLTDIPATVALHSLMCGRRSAEVRDQRLASVASVLPVRTPQRPAVASSLYDRHIAFKCKIKNEILEKHFITDS